jgi:integrase
MRIAKACDDKPSRAQIRIAWYSGMRKAELLRAEPVGDVWVLGTTKNGDPHVVPIHPRVRCCLNVPKPSYTKLGYWWRKAREKAGLQHIKFHALRHSTASEMINAGIDLHTVGQVLNHKSAASTKRYAHLLTKAKRVALQTVGKRRAA